MSDWSLTELFSSLHAKIGEELKIAREAINHPGTKGDTSERVWLGLLEAYLPKRYSVCGAHVVDSNGSFSDQIDVVIFDRQYSPFIFDFLGAKIVPAESVYAVFEAKQSLNAEYIGYARDKIQSVRKLHRTSKPIPATATGPTGAVELKEIIGGVLAFESEWSPPLGSTLQERLDEDISVERRLDIGCVSSHGVFTRAEGSSTTTITPSASATTRFLLELIAQLQAKGTVGMMDVHEYSKWLHD